MNEKQETKSKKKEDTTYSILSLLTLESPSSASHYCAQNQCFPVNHPAFSTTSLIPPDISATNTLLASMQNTTISEIFSSLPSELYEILSEAAQKGFLVSLLLTLSNEAATDLMKLYELHPDHIYLVNQALRALLLIGLGTSVPLAIATPLISFLLQHYCGFKQENANYLTTGISVGIGLLSSPENVMENGITILSSIGGSILGSRIAKYGYQVAKNVFFSAEQSIEDNHTVKLTPSIVNSL